MKQTIEVQNLRCGGCANTITKKLNTVPNLSEIEVDIEQSKISFKYESDEDVSAAKQKLKSLGYPTVDEDNSIVDKGKSFVSCATGKLS